MLDQGMLLQNRYCILHQIGGGGMGTVFLAEDTRLPGRKCTIKEMSPAQLAPQDRNWAIAAFRQEAQMLAGLNHPGLTAVTDFFPEGGNWYLVMDYVEGETLKDRLERVRGGRLPLEEALDIARQLCNVLEYLHGQDPPVVFRDLKPGNVMIAPQGEVKLIDFGIARFFKPGQTRDTVNLGTPGYAAPEQYGGLGQSDPRTDIYSLGVLLHRLVTGYDPTAAVAPFPLPPPRDLEQGLPAYMEDVISRATRMKPEARYQSIQELRWALFPPAETGPAQVVETAVYPPLRPPPLPPPPLESALGPPSPYIPLSCTLTEAMERISEEHRQGLVGNILRQILESDPVEGYSTALIGYPGIGMTTIIKLLKKDIIREQKGRAIVAHVGLSGGSRPVDPMEILRELKRGRGNLRLKLRRAVLKAYQQYDRRGSSSAREVRRRLKAGLPIQFTVSLPLLGTLTVGEPIEYESVVTERVTEPLASPTMSTQQEALRALRDLLDYLTERGVRIALVLDKVQNLAILEPLHRLMATPGIYTLITANKRDFEQWPPSSLTRRVCYVPCLWGIAQEVCNHLLRDCPERDSREVWALVNYLEFHGRGIPQRIVEMLERFYIPPRRRGNRSLRDVQPLLYLPQHRAHEIMSIAHIQTILDWGRLFRDNDGRSIHTVWNQEEFDQARMGVYAIMDWVLAKARQGERFSIRMLEEEAFSSGLPLSSTVVKLVVHNLAGLLKEAGARTTTRGFDVTRLLHLDSRQEDVGL
jgi:serine/threonine protein kinase